MRLACSRILATAFLYMSEVSDAKNNSLGVHPIALLTVALCAATVSAHCWCGSLCVIGCRCNPSAATPFECSTIPFCSGHPGRFSHTTSRRFFSGSMWSLPAFGFSPSANPYLDLILLNSLQRKQKIEISNNQGENG